MSDRDFNRHESIVRTLCQSLKFPGYGRVRDKQRTCYTITDIRALPVRLVEIKVHCTKRDKGAEYAFPLDSWTLGLDRAELFDCPFVLAVQWADFLGVISTKFITEPHRIGPGEDQEMAFFESRIFRAVRK
jgi:hypothetical protein